jgi:hypothetical protein
MQRLLGGRYVLNTRIQNSEHLGSRALVYTICVPHSYKPVIFLRPSSVHMPFFQQPEPHCSSFQQKEEDDAALQ